MKWLAENWQSILIGLVIVGLWMLFYWFSDDDDEDYDDEDSPDGVAD